jgi:hypothetical protein
MTLPKWFLALIAIVLLLGGGIALSALRDSRNDAAMAQAAERAAVARIATLEAQEARVDTQYAVDTVKVRETTTGYVQVRERIRTVTDTVPVPRYIVDTLILRADSAINACHVALRTCEQRVALADSLGVARLNLARIDMQKEIARKSKTATRRGIIIGAVGTGAAVWLAGRAMR